MKQTKVAINGMGRIGRTVLRAIYKSGTTKVKVVAVNNPGKPELFAHLLKYDSSHGIFDKEVKLDNGDLMVGGDRIKFFNEKDPSKIPWKDYGVEVVIDGTGIFKDKEGLGKHLGGSVKKVIMCAPGKDLDATFVVGVNTDTYDPVNHNIVSNASCTTNCLAPVAKVINDNFGIEKGLMVTIHSYTSDQMLLDGEHSDLRRARSAALSMVPTTTGAAKTVGVIIPALKGKLDGYAVRVPTPNVSVVDFTAHVKKDVTPEQLNAAMKKASENELKGILAYNDNAMVSVDYMGTVVSSTFDATLTFVIGNLVKVVAWYDNEVGFSNRVVDLATILGEKL